MSAADDTGRFAIVDPALGALPGSLLGFWQPEPAADEGLMFAAGEAAPAESAPAWIVDLPQRPGAAQALIADRARGAAAAQRALGGLEAQIRGGGPAEEVFFSGEASPLSTLQLAVAEEQRQLDTAGGWEQARRQFTAVLDAASRSIRYYAVVETALGGVTLARTSVGWGGDAATVIQGGAAPDQLQLHSQSLLVARRSRAILVQTVLVTVQAAAAIGTGNIFALPAIWRAVNTLASRWGGS